ncbi:MAG: exodeoxyribonuclease VII large subunit [Coriobacteriales bacterium]|jgi:exodeoxyribonuclease VII large subunit|nr:exodeoxyribonuclease VII large subunit [Coriobacteriales bacterium]
MTAQPLSVSQALARAKASLEQVSATIVGEISELSDKPGYKAVYFTLSDASSALSCLIWRNVYQRTGVELRQGMLVEVSGVFSVYAAKGRMNFEIKTLRLAGEGELRLKVAQLAKKLEAEGLMAPQRKRPLPPYPAKIALVTSPRGKAVHDVLRTLRRRYPLAEVLVAGVPVEGADAAGHIIRGLRAAQESGAEVILLVRGGGSYEDLMPFNDESLAREVAASPIPVVTGIGHEPDNSIADMVADFRASTPTAAAEHVAPAIDELNIDIARMASALTHSLRSTIQHAEATFVRLRERPVFAEPSHLFRASEMQLEGAAQRLRHALPSKLQRDWQRLDALATRMILLGSNLLTPFCSAIELGAAQLDSLSPLAVLARGYSITHDRNGHVIDSVDAVDLDEHVVVRLANGSLDCTVNGKRVNEKRFEGLAGKNTEAYHV